jgi:hypothetical protein
MLTFLKLYMTQEKVGKRSLPYMIDKDEDGLRLSEVLFFRFKFSIDRKVLRTTCIRNPRQSKAPTRQRRFPLGDAFVVHQKLIISFGFRLFSIVQK